MKHISILFIVIFMFFWLLVDKAEAYVKVRPYFRKNGTYVQPHFRTNPNNLKWDNWSFRGNINPFNGRRGYRWSW